MIDIEPTHHLVKGLTAVWNLNEKIPPYDNPSMVTTARARKMTKSHLCHVHCMFDIVGERIKIRHAKLIDWSIPKKCIVLRIFLPKSLGPQRSTISIKCGAFSAIVFGARFYGAVRVHVPYNLSIYYKKVKFIKEKPWI